MLRVYVVKDQTEEVISILRSVKKALVSRPELASCEIFKSLGEENSILFIEQWKTKQALRRHIQSDLYRRILTVMDLASRPPEVMISKAREGSRVIEMLRQGKREFVANAI